MQLFSQINQAGGDINLAVISQGIYTKLITSITGLVIGLIAFLCFNYLHAQIGRTVNKMEAAAADFLDVLQEPTK
jgi:biopolymer transport protein ExbB